MSNVNLAGLFENIGNVDAGGCPAPFIGESLYPYKGGFRGGRNCAENPLVSTANASRCCIPCPVFDWLYSDDFDRLADGAAWVNVTGFILCGFLLISMIVLPAKVTRRAYLNIVLLVGIMVLELGFIIPLARRPPQCYDAVTPNGMHSNTTCAVSGGLAAFGGMMLLTWILVRSLFMHLQICWNITPGERSYIAANVAAWAVTIGLTSAVLAKAGVSFRFGGYCHVNVGSISTYWAWILGFAGLAFLLQIATFAYCLKVYLSAALLGRQEIPSSGNKSSISGSTRSRTARASARRVRDVLLLQWRSLAIVALAIFTAAFVCIVFMVLDNEMTEEAFNNTESLVPWIICVIANQSKEPCLSLTGPIIIPEKIALATLFILGLVGIEAFLLLCRLDILRGWWDLIRTPFWRRKSKRATDRVISDLDTPGSPRKVTIERGSVVRQFGKETNNEKRHVAVERTV